METFVKQHNEADQQQRNLWVAKPSVENCTVKPGGGRGIEFFRSTETALRVIERASKPGSEHVVQRYVDRPLLLDGRKCDLRLYVLLVREPGPTGAVQAWRHTTANYARSALSDYDPERLDGSVHLTNVSFARRVGEHQRVETFEAVLGRLSRIGFDPTAIQRSIDACVVQSLAALRPTKHWPHCYMRSRSAFRVRHSVGREFTSVAARGEQESRLALPRAAW
jgi:hypothetical protein